MNAKEWPWIVGAALLAGAIFVFGMLAGRSAGSADLRAAVARYDALRSADDKYIGTALKSIGSALSESDRLAKSGSDIDATARSIAVLVTGIRDCVASLERAQGARETSGIPGNQGSPK
jgi:hypothetical protein